MALRLRRGTANDRAQLVTDGDTLNVGEPLWVYDDGKLYVGDGTTPGGALVSGGDATVAGSDTQVQYNNSDALGASANFTYNDSTTQLIVGDSTLATQYVRLDGSNGNIAATGAISATSFTGDGSGLTGVTATVTSVEGELIGSVFDDASNLIVDGINGHVYPTRLHNTFTTVLGNTNYIQGETDASTVTEIVETVDEKSALTLRRKSASDISGSDLTYGTISFQRSDTGGAATTAIISGTRDKLYLAQDATAAYALDKFVTLVNGQLVIGGVTPTAELDVQGNAVVTGSLTAGAILLSASNIDTDDSSAISVTPAVTFNSDVTVENDLIVSNKITVDTLEVTNFQTTGAGTPELESPTEILLTAGTRVEVTQSPIKMASFTTTERNALTAENGDIIYNTTDNKFQGYENGSWVNLV